MAAAFQVTFFGTHLSTVSHYMHDAECLVPTQR